MHSIGAWSGATVGRHIGGGFFSFRMITGEGVGNTGQDVSAFSGTIGSKLSHMVEMEKQIFQEEEERDTAFIF